MFGLKFKQSYKNVHWTVLLKGNKIVSLQIQNDRYYAPAQVLNACVKIPLNEYIRMFIGQFIKGNRINKKFIMADIMCSWLI